MAYAAVLAPPAMQDALRQPDKWNSEWEALIKTVERVSASDLLNSAAIQLAMDPEGMDWAFMEYQNLIARLCHVQAWLTLDASLYFARDDLEAKWLSATPDLRGKHLLIGLSNACSIAKNLHDARLYCGRELKLARLRGDGRVLLDLVRSVMVEGALEVPKEPRYVPHSAWDAVSEAQKRATPTDAEKLTLGRILVLRTKLICHVLHFTIRSFVGEELPEVTVSKNRKKKGTETFPSQTFAAAFMEQTLGPDGARAAVKDNKDALKDRKSKRKEHCSYTGCVKANNGDEKYPRCKKCWDQMQRDVPYCSVECQRADWKLYHKTICGKPLTFDAVSKPVLAPKTPPAPAVGPPVGGFKRSNLLALHITALTHLPKADYIIMGAEDTSVTIDLPDPEAQALFRKFREKAMTTGDKQSVATMAHFLCWMSIADPKLAARKDPTSNAIVSQMKKEYGFDELHLAVAEMQNRQNRDPLRRPVLLFSMSPQNWVKFCKGMNVNSQVVLD